MQNFQSGQNWTREEHLLAFNLYCKIPFGTIHMRNPLIIDLAKIMGRSTGSVSYKLANFSRFDPALQKRDIKGMPHGAKGEAHIWKEFQENPQKIAFESEELLAVKEGQTVETFAKIDVNDLQFLEGKSREALVQIRVNQSFFRKRVLSSYNFTCCVTGLRTPSLLVASHIIPWAKDTVNRLNARNGLCLNALHDRAFDRGLMWIKSDLTIGFSNKLKKSAAQETVGWMTAYEGKPLILPRHFSPDPSFLSAHASKC